MKVASAPFIAESIKKGNAPVTLVVAHFPAPTGDVYLSSQPITLGGHVYRSIVREWSPTYKQVSPDPLTFDVSDWTLVLSNTEAVPFSAYFAGIDPLQVSIDAYHWFNGLADTDMLPYDKYVLRDVPIWDRERVTLEFISQIDKKNKNIGTLITPANYPYADPDYFNWIEPIIYGAPKNVICPCTRGGGVSTLMDILTTATTTFKVSISQDDAIYPAAAPFTIQMGNEQMRVTALGADSKTWVVTRGYNTTTKVAHSPGEAFWEVRADYTYLASDRPVAALGDVYVDGNRVIAGFTKNISIGGKANIVFTSKIKFDKAVALAAADAGHSHPTDTTVVKYGTAGNCSKSDNGNVTWTGVLGNIVDQSDSSSLKATSTNNGLGTTFGMNSSGMSGVAGMTVSDVIVCVSHSSHKAGSVTAWDAFNYVKVSSSNWGGTNLDYSGAYGVQKFSTGATSVPSSIYVNGASQAGTGLFCDLVDVWLEIHYSSTGSGTAAVSLTGNSAADFAVGKVVTCDITAATNDCSDIIKDVAKTYGGYVDAEMNLPSFATARTLLQAAGYAFSFAIYKQVDLKTFLARLAFQARCRLLEEAGLLKLVYRSSPLGASVLAITKGMLLKNGITGGRANKDDILNDMKLMYNWNWSKGVPGGNDDKGWLGSCLSSATYPAGGDAASVAANSLREKPQWCGMEFINSATVATANRDFYIGAYKTRKLRYSVTGFSSISTVERTDVVDVTHDHLAFGLVAAKFEVLNVLYTPGSGKSKRGHHIELTLEG